MLSFDTVLFSALFVYRSKCQETIAMADFQKICHPHILPKSRVLANINSAPSIFIKLLRGKHYGFDNSYGATSYAKVERSKCLGKAGNSG